MTISALQIPFPSRLPRAPRGAAPVPAAARLRAAQRWASVPGTVAGGAPSPHRVAFEGSTSVTAVPSWTGWTVPVSPPVQGVDAA